MTARDSALDATAQRRWRTVLERAQPNEALIAQDRASLQSYLRGEPPISGDDVRAEADARLQHERGA